MRDELIHSRQKISLGNPSNCFRISQNLFYTRVYPSSVQNVRTNCRCTGNFFFFGRQHANTLETRVSKMCTKDTENILENPAQRARTLRYMYAAFE